MTWSKQWQDWANFVLGAWIAISPWVLGYSPMTTATRNAVVSGLLVAGIALWALATRDLALAKWWRDRHSH